MNSAAHAARSRLRASVVSSCLLVGACTVKDPLFCDDTHPCSDRDRPYCDRTGQYENEHIRNTCIPSPFAPDAGVDAAPGTLTLDVANDRFFLPTDGTVSIGVTVSRGAGVEGDVAVVVASLPGGVTFDPLVIVAGSNTGALVGHAAHGAPYARQSVIVTAVDGSAKGEDVLDLDVIGKPGELDTSFGGSGMVILPPPWDGGTHDVFAQGDKVVIVSQTTNLGSRSVNATRLLPDGSPDPTFGTQGSYTDDFSAIGLQQISIVAGVQSDGKIVIAGSGSNGKDGDPFIVRLTKDGQIDSSLVPHRLDVGASDDNIQTIAIGPQDEILIGGYTGPLATSQGLLMRLGANGQVDYAFGGGRVLVGPAMQTYVQSMTVLQDGSVIPAVRHCPNGFCETSPSLVRYDVQGKADNGFGTAGSVTPTVPGGMGYLRAVGYPSASTFVGWGGADSAEPAIWSFSNAGQPNPQFGTGGLFLGPAAASGISLVSAATAQGIAGLMYVGFYNADTSPFSYRVAIIRVDNLGVLDPTVGAGGVARDASAAFIVFGSGARSDHRLVVVGALNLPAAPQLAVRSYFW